MNQRSYSILFCVLLASTFIHELRAKGVAPVNPVGLGAAEHVELERVKRFEPEIGLSLQVIADLLVISNTSCNAALAIDVSSNVFALLNGTSGSGVVIDRSENKGVYFSKNLWEAEEESLNDFLESLKHGLSELLERHGGKSFKLHSVKKTILREIKSIVTYLVFAIDGDLKKDLSLALELVLSVVDGMVEVLSGVLDGLLDIIGDSEICLYVDIFGLLHILNGLATVIELTCDDIETCEKKHVEFDAEELLGNRNGLETLTNLLRQLGGCVDLSPLSDLLGNVESLFDIIAQLGGYSLVGINGVIKVVEKIVSYLNGHIFLSAVISRVIQYVAYSSISIDRDLTHKFNQELEELLEVLEEVNVTECLSDMVKIIKDLIKGKLEFGGINLSEVIEKLFKGIIDQADCLLGLIVEILLLLDPVIRYTVSIPYLLLVLIINLKYAYGIDLLKIIGIEVRIGVYLKDILSGIKHLSHILSGNLYDALCGLPIIGNIVRALEYALKEASKGELNLRDLLHEYKPIRYLILGVFQYTSGIVLNVSNAALAKVEEILKYVTSIWAFVAVDMTTAVSVAG